MSKKGVYLKWRRWAPTSQCTRGLGGNATLRVKQLVECRSGVVLLGLDAGRIQGRGQAIKGSCSEGHRFLDEGCGGYRMGTGTFAVAQCAWTLLFHFYSLGKLSSRSKFRSEIYSSSYLFSREY